MDLLLALGVLTLLTRVGFALYAVGLVRAKNSAGTLFRLLLDLAISTLAFWLIGAAIMFQSKNEWFGFHHDYFGWSNKNASIVIFANAVLVLTATQIVGSALAERSRLLPIGIVSLLMAGLVLPVGAKWMTSGWLAVRGYADVGYVSAYQVSAGVFALVAAAFVGPRQGKYNRDGSSSIIPGHSVPLSIIGTVVLVIGWIGYAGSASILRAGAQGAEAFFAGKAAMNVLLAVSAGALVSALLSHFRYGKPDVLLTLTGILGAAVAAAAGGAFLLAWHAVVIGAVAGIIVPLTAVALDLRGRIDDPMGVIAIHCVGGAWGTIAVGLFMERYLARTRFHQILLQIIGVAAMALLAALVAAALFAVLRVTGGLRGSEADEFDGFDLAEHDIGSYPDFQQNTIKSYHLRER